MIRGEDHLSNTPKHLELYSALGATPPRFAHIPLILNKEGRKMSKRDGGSSITAYIDQGYAPEAVANYLCLLGWSPGDNREVFSIGQLRELFDLGHVNRRNAIFDLDKCFYIQGQHILGMDLDRFVELGATFLDRAGISYGSADALRPVFAIVKEKIKLLADLPAWTGYFFTEDFEMDPQAVAKTLGNPEVFQKIEALRGAFAACASWDAVSLEAALKATAGSLGCKTGDLIHPARVATSGRSVGPSLYPMLEVLGRERVLDRLAKAPAAASKAMPSAA